MEHRGTAGKGAVSKWFRLKQDIPRLESVQQQKASSKGKGLKGGTQAMRGSVMEQCNKAAKQKVQAEAMANVSLELVN